MTRRSVRPTGRRLGSSMKNWAGNQAFHSRRFFEPESVEELAEIVRSSAVDSRARHTAFVQSAGRHHRRSRLARSPGGLRSAWIRTPGPSRSVAGSDMASCAVPRIGRVCAGQPRLAAAYLGRGLVRDRQPRVGRPESQPRGRRRCAGDRPGRWRDRADRPRHARRRAAWGGRLARCARRRQQRDARHRADIPDAPGRVRRPRAVRTSSIISRRSSRRPTASASSPTGADRRSTRCG